MVAAASSNLAISPCTKVRSRQLDEDKTASLQRDVQFILGAQESKAAVKRLSGTRRLTAASTRPKPALLAAIGASAIAILMHFEGEMTEERSPKSVQLVPSADHVAPELTRVGRAINQPVPKSEFVVESRSGLVIRNKSVQTATTVQTGAGVSAASRRGGEAMPMENADYAIRRTAAIALPQMVEVPLSELPATLSSATAMAPKVVGSETEFARSALPLPPLDQSASVKKSEKPNAAARRESIDAMLDLRRQW